MKHLVLFTLTILLFVGVAQAEMKVSYADYWRGRPIAQLDTSKVKSAERYYASPYGWTSREPISSREYRRLERRSVCLQQK